MTVKVYLDREPGVVGFVFVDKPVWYSVEVDVSKELVETNEKIRFWVAELTKYLSDVYEAKRAGAVDPELPFTVKRIIELCQAPEDHARAKKQKKPDSEAASSSK